MARSPSILFPLAALAFSLGLAPDAWAQPVAAFDWSMPARYGMDADGDGLIDEMTTAAEISPTEWAVDFDACASTGSIVEYRWNIDGVVTATTHCTQRVTFPEEGPHDVILTVKDAAGNTSSTPSTHVVVQDFLIIGVGDSLSSGEGNPTVPADLTTFPIGQPRWQDRQCHRSQISWQSQVALAIEQSDPHTSVTFIHLACSGATVDAGLLGPYAGIEPDAGSGPKEAQIRKAAELAGGREVDAMLLSIGANDLDFGDIVINCMGAINCHDEDTYAGVDTAAQLAWNTLCAPLALFGLDDECRAFLTIPPSSAVSIYNGNISTLAGHYHDLANELKLRFPDMPSARVYSVGYPELTRDENGNLCNEDPIGFEVPETAWADGVVTPGLNGAIDNSTKANGWHYVDGIPETFRLHGYCASPGHSWARRIEDSVLQQLNHNGGLHPTAPGHASYRDHVLAALLPALYLGGDPTKPREPEVAPIADAGGPYRFDEGSTAQTHNGSSDPNGDPLTYHWSAGTAAVSFSDASAAEPVLSAADDTEGSISLTANDGQLSDSDTAQVTVSNVAPRVDLSGAATSGAEGILFSLHGSFADPGPLDTHTGSIAWGDGSFTPIIGASSQNNTIAGSHLYPDNGSFDVTVTITDDDGGVGFATRTVTIQNLPPTDLAFQVLAPMPEGSTSQASVSFSDLGVNDTHTASVAWGDGAVTGPSAVTSPFGINHVYQDNGLFPIVVTVRDDDGGSAVLSGALDVVNVPPSAGTGSGSGTEGSPASLSLPFSDPGALDTHSATIDWGDGSSPQSLASVVSPLAATHVYVDDGNYTAAVTIRDDDGGSVDASVSVAVANADPVVAVSPGGGTEGSSVSIPISFTDAGVLDTHTASIAWGDGQESDLGTVTSPLAPVHVYADDGSYTVVVSVQDDDGGSGSASATATVLNAAPVVEGITGLEEPIPVNAAVSATAAFSDAGPVDTHTASFDWGDGTVSPASVVEGGGAGVASGAHTYGAPGVYAVTLSVTDDDGATTDRVYQYAVVYDPAGGFVTGAGTIDSPAGAYTPDPTLAGTANFGFVARYQNGASTVPVGTTQFRFATAGLAFTSDAYQWLVVAGQSAKYKGVGALNGESGFGFLLSASDGDAKQNPQPDRFRIKIWDLDTEEVVYDNQSGDGDDADASAAITSGNIVVHK